jgi:hypothetical protein
MYFSVDSCDKQVTSVRFKDENNNSEMRLKVNALKVLFALRSNVDSTIFKYSVPKRCIHKVNIPYYVYISFWDTLYSVTFESELSFEVCY